ncbi:hypothetical protein CC1G_14117 [Coprinopsis cinerea okayama7|uniref:F-box domain-containing protein n=1 Tax=Coprinopsis cinerea (strain Okayama-7 / 130 / ATCC MYA-4618 / FGSC 9003) TaxID=240176 RepID=D6RLJ8_COPC7|nr:hypothetical protein CC1G_14117 [Coprinopsis cinerea okayama7\|eukprot:XP_002911584.1 hypothetical protein CC1G_14117 [Coprinopsis cinerea okayama7\
MHRCLEIPEVVQLVFENLSGTGKDGNTPASIARVCKTFHDPAIRVIWRKIPGLDVLTCLFSRKEKALIIKKVSSIQKQRVVTMFLQDSGFLEEASFSKTFLRYSSLVQEIEYPEDLKRPVFHHSVLQAFYVDIQSPGPLFPNVKKITLPCFSARPLEAIFYPGVVLSPSVRAVTITTDELVDYVGGTGSLLDKEYWKTIGSRLEPFAARLSSLTIGSNTRTTANSGLSVPVVNDLCSKFGPIQSLDLDGVMLSIDTLVLLSRCDTLRYLACVVPSIASQFPDSLMFPILDTLNLEICGVPSVSVCNAILRRLRAPSLCSLSLGYNVNDLASKVSLEETFVALCQDSVFPGLSRIEIDSGPEAGPDGPDTHGPDGLVISKTTFDPLLGFANLNMLIVSGYSRVDLDDADLLRAFASWPKLTEFWLYPSGANEQGWPSRHQDHARGGPRRPSTLPRHPPPVSCVRFPHPPIRRRHLSLTSSLAKNMGLHELTDHVRRSGGKVPTQMVPTFTAQPLCVYVSPLQPPPVLRCRNWN